MSCQRPFVVYFYYVANCLFSLGEENNGRAIQQTNKQRNQFSDFPLSKMRLR